MSATSLISFASWEPRFLSGAISLLDKCSLTDVVVPFAEEYASRTEPNRLALSAHAKAAGVSYEEFPTSLLTSINCWNALSSRIPSFIGRGQEIVFDISTCPREALWYVLHILVALDCSTKWRYHRPKSYTTEWLSRNAQSPRVLLKRSGIALPGKKTCIIALAGFDTERLAQLMEKYEPSNCMVGRQTGNQLENKSRNSGFDSSFVQQRPISVFDFDCYDASTQSLEMLVGQIPEEIWQKYNVVGASLGPKPSAITMFELSQLHPEMALVYVPSGEYNINYSSGIDLSTFSEGVVRSRESLASS